MAYPAHVGLFLLFGFCQFTVSRGKCPKAQITMLATKMMPPILRKYWRPFSHVWRQTPRELADGKEEFHDEMAFIPTHEDLAEYPCYKKAIPVPNT